MIHIVSNRHIEVINLFTLIVGLEKLNVPKALPYVMTNDGSQTLFSTLHRYIPNLFLVLWRYGLDALRLNFL
ncbi:unnamed protein product, partial [Adineta steineri]